MAAVGLEEVLDVPPDACAALVVGTSDNSCAWGIDDSAAARAVVVRRTREGTNWSVLIRSRADTGEGRIAYGYPSDDDCARCMMQGSATGGDLRLHGVGGELPRGDREAVLILDNAGAPMWLRFCAP